MYAECPHCHAIFRVTQAILQRANGKVRCGECGTVFQALTRGDANEATPGTPKTPIIDSKPLEAPINPAAERDRVQRRAPQSAPTPAREPKPTPQTVVTAAGAVHHRSPHPLPHPAEGALPKPPGEPTFARIQLPIPTQQPVFTKAATRKGTPLSAWLGALTAIALILLLAAQYLRAHRYALANYAELRPLLFVICRASGCELPPRRDLDKLELLSHGVFSHPTTEGALMIKARFVNRANFEQPYPVVQVSLANLQGQIIARRRFSPNEYLDPQSTPTATLGPGQTAQLSLEVNDPGRSALAFEFEFL